jgi:hypothetical protein
MTSFAGTSRSDMAHVRVPGRKCPPEQCFQADRRYVEPTPPRCCWEWRGTGDSADQPSVGPVRCAVPGDLRRCDCRVRVQPVRGVARQPDRSHCWSHDRGGRNRARLRRDRPPGRGLRARQSDRGGNRREHDLPDGRRLGRDDGRRGGARSLCRRVGLRPARPERLRGHAGRVRRRAAALRRSGGFDPASPVRS